MIMISYESWPTKIRLYYPDFHIDHLTEKIKNIRQLRRIRLIKNESFCSDDDMINEGSEDQINENQSQQEV